MTFFIEVHGRLSRKVFVKNVPSGESSLQGADDSHSWLKKKKIKTHVEPLYLRAIFFVFVFRRSSHAGNHHLHLWCY